MSEDLENIEDKNITPGEKGDLPESHSEPVSGPEEKPEESSEVQENEPLNEKEQAKPEKPLKQEKKPEEEEKHTVLKNLPKETNYQVSLINENLLKIRLSTLKSVSIDCFVKDKTSEGDSSESQTNKIQIHPKPDNQPQEVEIIISIDPESGNIVVEKKKMKL